MLRRISALLLSGVSLSAFAGGSTPLASPLASQRSASSAEQTVGLGIGVGPSYLGGRKTVWRAGLLGEANWENGMFLSTMDGIGYRFPTHQSGLSFAASLGPGMARNEKDSEEDKQDRLKGMGDVNTRAQANLFVNYDVGRFHASTVLRQTLGGRRGTEVEVQGRYDIVADHSDLVQVSGGFAYANKSLMQTFFGVNASQAANSGNAIYTPKAGIAGFGTGVMWRHAFNSNWVSTVSAGVVSLHGPAADSPLTERRTSGVLGASIGYRF